jgi:hypothetical protein
MSPPITRAGRRAGPGGDSPSSGSKNLRWPKSSFANPEACLRAEVPASRDFREVEDVATACVLANDRLAAFGAIATPGSEQVQCFSVAY